MEQRDVELEPDAPNWLSEPSSDQLLLKALRARLDKPILKRQIRDWRDRGKVKAMIKRLRDLGIEG